MTKHNAGIKLTHLNIRLSIFVLALRLTLLDILSVSLILFFFVSLFLPGFSTEAKILTIENNILLFLVLVLVKIALTILVVLQWINEYWEISAKETIHRAGIIWRKEEKYEIINIKSLQINQGIVDRFFDFGNLRFYERPTRKNIALFAIHNPIKCFKVLESLLIESGRENEAIRKHVQECTDETP